MATAHTLQTHSAPALPGFLPAPGRRPAARSAAPASARLDDFADDRSFVMSLARGVCVIQAFANASRPLSIAEISHRVDLPRATVRRLLHTWCGLGYVQVAGMRFTLAPKTLELGNAFASSNSIAIAAQPIVNRLAGELRTFCALSVREDDKVMVMCLAGSSTNDIARRTSSGPGSKAPLYASASGLLFLSACSDDELEAYFARVSLQPITFRTLTSPEHVRAEIGRVRTQGFAVCDRAFAEELLSVAVPVRNKQGSMVAAVLAVLRNRQRTDPDLGATVLPALRNAAGACAQRWAPLL